jgi:hypothetical protein
MPSSALAAFSRHVPFGYFAQILLDLPPLPPVPRSYVPNVTAELRSFPER